MSRNGGGKISFVLELEKTGQAPEIAEKIAAEQELSKAQGKALVESVIKAITDAAVAGDEVSLPGFGKFKVKATPARDGRNPSTGETIKIAAANKLTLTPAKALKDALNK